MFTWTKRLVGLFVVLQVIYLLVANVILNQQFIRDEINQIKPEKWSVEWKQIRSYFPTHVHLEGLTAAGSTSRNHWEFSAEKATIQIDVFAIPQRIARIHSGDLENVSFKLVQTPGNENAQSTSTKSTSPGHGKKWMLDINRLATEGTHRVELPKADISFNGTLSTKLNYTASTGTLAMGDGYVDVEIKHLSSNSEILLGEGARVEGSFTLLPFIPKKNRGKKALAFLQTEANVSITSADISFLNPYIQRFKGMTLSGKGKIDGFISYDKGVMKAPTAIQIKASPLQLALLHLDLQGAGNIAIRIDEEREQGLVATVLFDEIVAYEGDSTVVLVEGSNLRLEADTPTFSLLTKPEGVPDGSLRLTIPQMQVPDISVYQKYVPEKLRLELNSGAGFLSGSAEINNDNAALNLNLTAKDASIALNKYLFKSGISLQLAIDVASFASPLINFTGTAMRLENATLDSHSAESGGNEEVLPFSMHLGVDAGSATFVGGGLEQSSAKWIDKVRQKKAMTLLQDAEIDMTLLGEVSDLRWIGQLVRNNGFSIQGAGKLSATIKASAGNINTGSRMLIEPNKLSATFLDYQIEGDGLVALDIERGGLTPDVAFSVNFDKGAMKRISDEVEFASVRDVSLTAIGRQVEITTPIDNADLHVKIPFANVHDMTVYNSFLPAESPLKILSGTAVMTADINLSKELAIGRVELETDLLKAAIDKQSVGARLRVGVDIVGGDPSQMRFDISGSKLQVDQISVQVEGQDAEQWRDGDWLGEIVLNKGQVRWRKPIELELEADLELDDTRPFVAILSNHTGRRNWLEKLLSVEDVKGTGRMTLRNNKMQFPLIFVDAGEVKMGAKGFIEGNNREGVIYARYKKLGGLLKVAGEKAGFDLLKAKTTFDQYSPGNPLFIKKKTKRSDSETNRDTLPSDNTRAWQPKSGEISLEPGARP